MDGSRGGWPVDAAFAFERDGFVVSSGPVLDPAMLDDIRVRLDRLHGRAAELGPRHAGDLGPVHHHDGRPDISEITQAREVDRDLASHPAVMILRDLAADLLGARAWCAYDHSIYKPAACPHDIAWHQDAWYWWDVARSPSIHLWLALDDVDESTGGLRYWPGSHRHGMVEHVPAHPAGRGHQQRAEVEPSDVVCPTLPAGAVVGHHPMTVHSSGTSTSPRPRRSWTLQMRTGREPSRAEWRARRVAARLRGRAGGSSSGSRLRGTSRRR